MPRVRVALRRCWEIVGYRWERPDYSRIVIILKVLSKSKAVGKETGHIKNERDGAYTRGCEEGQGLEK